MHCCHVVPHTCTSNPLHEHTGLLGSVFCAALSACEENPSPNPSPRRRGGPDSWFCPPLRFGEGLGEGFSSQALSPRARLRKPSPMDGRSSLRFLREP